MSLPICAKLSLGLLTDTLSLWNGICLREGGGRINPRAFNRAENAAGVAQIRPTCVRDVNRIARARFTLTDRWSPQRSFEMFVAYTTHYVGLWAPPEHKARLWNGGPGWRRKQATVGYWLGVRKHMSAQSVRK